MIPLTPDCLALAGEPAGLVQLDEAWERPLLEFTPQVMGPGGEAFFTDAEGNLWMAYHAWIGPTVGYAAGQRALHIDPVTFVGDQLVITGPNSDPQPLPS
jgi:hypothetical protein